MPGFFSSPRRRRRIGALALIVAVGLGGLLTVRAAVAEVFLVPTSRVAPEVPPGARVVVSKLTRSFAPGDIVAYRVPDGVWLGRVTVADERARTVHVTGNANDVTIVALDEVVGKVILNSR